MAKIELWQVFTQAEADLLSEALQTYLGVKLEALATINTDFTRRGVKQRFTEDDFAIPSIRALIQRFDY